MARQKKTLQKKCVQKAVLGLLAICVLSTLLTGGLTMLGAVPSSATVMAKFVSSICTELKLEVQALIHMFI